MKLIAGLGNPGPRYADSRHNIGFLVLDELARRWGADVSRYDRHFEGLLGEATVQGETVLLLKPATYMNLSGRSVAATARYYKLPAEAVLVIYDDLDLPVGQLRVRAAGSSGGHKGMDDVIRQFGTDTLPRIRSRFEPDERPAIEAAVQRAADAVACWLRRGLDAAMNEFNRKQDAESRPRPRPGDPPSEGDPS